MNTLYIAFDKALVIAHQQHQRWEANFHLEESQPQCLAIDPLHPQNVYCGTFDQGLWMLYQRSLLRSMAAPHPLRFRVSQENG
jgi:hypothetical protein